MLFTVFDSDTRVDPLHARKMCAALQHATAARLAGSPHPAAARTDVGHGARAVSRSASLAADTLAFLAGAHRPAAASGRPTRVPTVSRRRVRAVDQSCTALRL